jgi:VWFA-related protein
MLRGAAALLLGGLLGLGSPAGAATVRDKPQDPKEQDKKDAASFSGVIDVAIVTVVVRVVDTWGRPILGLKPEDFRVRVGKREIPVAGLDWIGEGAGEVPTQVETSPLPAPSLAEEATAEAQSPPPSPQGKLVVFFVQADLRPSRISGQLRLRPFTRQLLATLQPSDRVAVVSYDSHLKLWQDFTADRDATHAVLDQAMLFSEEPGIADLAAGDPVSLADHFDRANALAAASPERGLEVLGKAMEPLRGEKTMIFLGWGLGRFSTDGVRMTPAYKPAVRALRAAHASVFVLDVTSADAHSLETGLEGIAEATGGMYLKTFRLPGLATEVLAKTISGHYVLTLDRALLSGEAAEVSIELREKSGTVLARPVILR